LKVFSARFGLLRSGVGLIAILLSAGSPLCAQRLVATIDPAATQIHFTLGATMHTVHGTFKLKSGQMQWDPATGAASGAVAIDATSGNTDNSGRDKNMHSEVLESAQFPEIVFTPSQIKGALAKNAPSEIEARGVIRLLGQDHDTVLKLTVQPAGGDQLQVSTQFGVPWKSWGLKDPSTFLLHVADTVDLEIQAMARLANAR